MAVSQFSAGYMLIFSDWRYSRLVLSDGWGQVVPGRCYLPRDTGWLRWCLRIAALTMSTRSLRWCSEKPEPGWSEEPLPAMPGRDLKDAGADGAGVLMADMSFVVEWGCCGCLLSDGRRVTPASWSRLLGGNERLLDWSVCFSWEFDLVEEPAAVRNAFPEFRKAARSTAQSSGQSQAGCSV